jgi:Ca-activated chloride channel family protein
MRRGQLFFAIIAALAVGLTAVLAGGGGKDDKSSTTSTTAQQSTKPAKNAVRVPFAYSPEKEKLLLPLIDEFNRAQSGDKPTFIEGANVSSGIAEQKIAKGTLQTVAWSPASSLWGRLLNFEADQPYTPDESPSIVRTPLVIAMWEPMAKLLGWPNKKVGFDDILQLSVDQTGWGRFGHPELGRFKLGHTNPDVSTSGLAAVMAEYYAATGKKEGLTVADIKSSKSRDTVKGIEKSIVHYGDTTLFFAEQMKKEGPSYASAVAMEEVTLLDFNRTRGKRDRLVALYPKEGTFFSDSPFIVLDAPWVTPEQAAGAQAFQKFLAGKITPELAAKFGFRPASLDQKPVAPITAANGVDPAQPERVFGQPDPAVVAAAKAAWREDRKPANVLLVLDTSGSMNDENRLVRAKEGLGVFLRQVGKQDSVGLTTFDREVHPQIEIAPLPDIRDELKQRISDLSADGGTSFYDAALAGFETVRELRDADRINAVVLLTDGEDTDSGHSPDDVVAQLGRQGDSENRVRVFTIAYSAGAAGARKQLERIAAASGGQSYEGKTETIEAVYASISSFF